MHGNPIPNDQTGLVDQPATIAVAAADGRPGPVSAAARPSAQAAPNGAAPLLAHAPGPGIAGRRVGDGEARPASDDWAPLFARLSRCLASLATAPSDATVAAGLEALEQLKALHACRRDHDRRREGERRQSRDQLAATCDELVAARLSERRAQHQAQHDSLTQLPNRSSFSARLRQALRDVDHRGQSLAVLYLDLDGFKPINDCHGHAAGDAVLRIVANRLRRSVRQQDLVCRVGGDEFACILAEPMGREQLGRTAAKLLEAVSAPLKVRGAELAVRSSIGIAVCPSDGDSAATLLRSADAAMYRAKRRQLGFAFYDRCEDR